MSGVVHVFVGPTLPPERVRELLPAAVVHEPIRHLSLLQLTLAPGDTVAVIDGVFLQSPAIRHKELLHVLEQGVSVWGASSMGALRAAELGPFGMRGVGIVHRLFASNVLDRDDEVAVLHATAEAGHRPLSMALVSIRVLARRARRARLIADRTEMPLVAAAAELPFAERRLEMIVRLAERSGANQDECAAFLRLARDPTNDVKRQDAELLLRGLAAGRWRQTPARSSHRQPRTRYLTSWLESTRSTEVDGTRVRDADVLVFCQAFADDYAAWHRHLVLSAIVASDGIAPAPEASRLEVEQAALEIARARGVLPRAGSPLTAALRDWLAPQELDLPVAEAGIHVLVRTYRRPPDLAADALALDALRRSETFALAQRHVARAQRLNAEAARRDARHTPDRIAEPHVRAHFAARWSVTAEPDRFTLALLDRGILSRQAFTRLVRPHLPYAVLGRVPPFALCPFDCKRRPPVAAAR
ncbi:MAG TPA: TfuA-like protein [Conexibacter sp.]|nr:TfuA-like protein [Conexibacter sp.]